jgi:hypothetical protein
MEPVDRLDRRWCLAAALARHAGDDVAALRLAGDLAAFLANGTQFGPLLGVETPARGTVCAEKHTVPLSPPLAETLAALRSLDQDKGVPSGDVAEATGTAVETTRYRLRKLRDAGLVRLKGKTTKARWFASAAAGAADAGAADVGAADAGAADAGAADVGAADAGAADVGAADAGAADVGAADAGAADVGAADAGAAVKHPLSEPAAQAMRKCLGGCGRDFLSAGKGNRICPGCTVKNSKRAGGVDVAAGIII